MEPDASFFDSPEPDSQEDDYVQPEWLGPPSNELGRTVSLDADLVRSPDLAVAIRGAHVFSTGLLFQLVALVRTSGFGGNEVFDAIVGDSGSENGLRFGVLLGDGTKATTIDAFPEGDWDEETEEELAPSAPVLAVHGAGGSGLGQTATFWLWPLPPPGELTFVIEWQAMGTPLTWRSVETAPLLAAADGSDPLWELPYGS